MGGPLLVEGHLSCPLRGCLWNSELPSCLVGVEVLCCPSQNGSPAVDVFPASARQGLSSERKGPGLPTVSRVGLAGAGMSSPWGQATRLARTRLVPSGRDPLLGGGSALLCPELLQVGLGLYTGRKWG